jgi:hypothetical protein
VFRRRFCWKTTPVAQGDPADAAALVPSASHASVASWLHARRQPDGEVASLK